MKALLLVDLQNDFVPGGPLGVKGAQEIFPVINELLKASFDLIVATKDWHPSNHGSFANNHSGMKPGEQINLGGLNQILWPAHCVQGTLGAEFAPGWNCQAVNKVIHKGTEALIDSYSTFFDNGHRQTTHLENYFRDRGVEEVFVAGLATDYCVKYTVLDALELGFKPYVIVDACRGVNIASNDSENALKEMENKGAVLITSEEVKKYLSSKCFE